MELDERTRCFTRSLSLSLHLCYSADGLIVLVLHTRCGALGLAGYGRVLRAYWRFHMEFAYEEGPVLYILAACYVEDGV